ncbi:MAG TPA: hypothetical protein VER39_03675 [Nocardioidaceae bacterium]|nr:hypothetical protein [Nocardioidaceae bacterium]
MLPVTPLPAAGEVFLDTRGSGRALRVAWHVDAHGPAGGQDTAASGLVVLSLWHGDTCTGSFRMEAADVPTLVAALQDGLSRAGVARRSVPSTAEGLTG